jgi:hypothetical protein
VAHEDWATGLDANGFAITLDLNEVVAVRMAVVEEWLRNRTTMYIHLAGSDTPIGVEETLGWLVLEHTGQTEAFRTIQKTLLEGIEKKRADEEWRKQRKRARERAKEEAAQKAQAAKGGLSSPGLLQGALSKLRP